MPVQFRVLGEVEALVDGHAIDLGPRRQRCVLAVLLVEANRAVPADTVIDRVWGARPPQRTRATLYSYLSRLRHVLADTDVRLIRGTGGFVLEVDPAAVDLSRFRQLVGEARASDEDDAALALFERALALWRGAAFGDLDPPWLADLRAELDGERHAAELDRVDVALRRGRHAELISETATRAAQYPLDERCAGQLMLALYRNGRQADALHHYDLTRRRLLAELGAEPSPALSALHQRILNSEVEPAAQPTREQAPIPRQLPAAPALFSGRAGELAALSAVSEATEGSGRTVVISAIGGAGGIGKTWLALHWSYRHLDRFPDGQLFADLRGFAPSGEPTTPDETVRGFLEGLGVAPARIPVGLAARLDLYRGLVAGRRMLIVLDNAADSDQVTPLLPGSPTCTVLITSRDRLTDLVTTRHARPIPVDVLYDGDARDLLAARIGAERLAAEPEATAELLAYCGGFPLALSILAGRATTHPGFPLSALAAELRGAGGTVLSALNEDDPTASLPAVLSWSYAALTPEQARVFGLLGLAPGPDIGLSAAASLIGMRIGQARTVLRLLEQVSLVQQHKPGRYRMHDLIRLYAAEQAERDVPAEMRAAALRRLVDYHLHTALAGERALEPERDRLELTAAVPGCHPEPLADATAALAWFDAEYPCLLATQQLALATGWDQPAWQLAWLLHTYQYRRSHLLDQMACWRIALTAADRLADPVVQSHAHRLLGHACVQAGRLAEGQAQLEQALALAERTGDIRAQAHTHHGLTLVWEQQDDDLQALAHANEALRLYRAMDDPDPVREAETLNAVGWFQARLGHHDEARAACERALVLARQHNYLGEAAILDSLGYIAHHAGKDPETAIGYYTEALSLFRTLGNAFAEANTLDNLGDAHAANGTPASAREAWDQALERFRAQGRTADAERVQQRLATLEN